jgi:hypothetical protein
MGAPNGKINFQSMDVSASTGAICVGGRTNDHSLKGSPPSTKFIPFIVYYEHENYSIKWLKYADLETSNVRTVGFSPNGNELFAFFEIT